MSSAAKAANTNTPPAPPKAARMTLGSIVRGKQEHPLRIVLYGVPGIGKSTFAASAPSPIFIGAEDGTSNLDVARFRPEVWPDVLEAVATLTNENSEYRTAVIDTLDWAEPLLWAHICKRDGKKSIEDYGFNRGYQAAVDEWRVFLAALERLRAARSMNVILLAHSNKKRFNNPLGEDYMRFEMKMHDKAAGLITEWVDAQLFAQYETYAAKDQKTQRVRGVDTGARLIHTEHRAAFDAKNRYGLPETLPLSWSDFEAAVRAHQPADPKALTEEIRRKAKELGAETEKLILESLQRVGSDAEKLAQLNNRVNARLAQKEESND